MPGTSTYGTPIPLDSDPAGDLADAVRDVVDSLEAGWTAFTPVWTGATTNPAIGNAVLVGRYKRIGKTIFYRVAITMGTTTTYGSGQYSLSLPFTAHASGTQIIAAGEVQIGGSIVPIRGRVLVSAASALLYCPGLTAGGSDRAVLPTVPGTFANGTIMVLEGSYEAA